MRRPFQVILCAVVQRCAVAGLLLGLQSCASVQLFDVRPRLLCAGETVRVSWAASGTVSIRPLPDHAAPLESAGSIEVPVRQSTRFELRASRAFGDAEAAVDVEVAPVEPVSFSGVATCDAQAGELETRFVLDQLSNATLVERVRNLSERALIVTREGHEVRLEPECDPGAAPGCATESDALRDHLARGAWRLRSPLASGEDCDAALRSVRQRLSVELDLKCGG